MAERITDTIETARVRRSPKYSVFLLLGAAVGIVAALVLTFVFARGADDVTAPIVYSSSQIFGFLALICISIGVVLGGVVALILDRTVGRRYRDVRVDREHVREEPDAG